jgi:hypothetical protein
LEQDDASERRLAMEPPASSRLVSDVDSHIQQAAMVNALQSLVISDKGFVAA